MGRRSFHGPSPGCGGSILIGLVITIVVFAIVGAVILSMYGAADLTQVGSNNATRAYYLAESGYRYATGEFLATGDDNNSGSAEDDRNRTLKSLHDQGTLQLAQDQGGFAVKIYPYYVVADGNQGAGVFSLQTRFAGQRPPSDGFAIPAAGGRLKIANTFYDYSSYTAANGLFTLSTALEKSIDDGMGIYFVARPAAGGGTLSAGGSLALVADQGAWFPALNGSFRIDGLAGTFGYRVRTADTLFGIRDRDRPQRGFSIPIASSMNVQLEPLFLLKATGIAGSGALETRRSVDFFVQVATEQTVTVQETFDDTSLPNWERDAGTGETTMGSFAVATIDEDKALKVTGTSEGAAGAPKVSLIAFKPAAAGLDLAGARTSAGGFLSYDAQVKVGFQPDPAPVQGFDPSPIPKYFAAGLSFRLDRADEDGNYYGLSLMRGDKSLASPFDNIPDPIVAQDGRLCLVLWQQTALGVNRAWLAYKDLSGAVFQETVESGENGWTRSLAGPNNLWHISENRSNSFSHSWYYGREVERDYDVGTTRGSLISPPIDLCSALKSVYLRYASWHRVEETAPTVL